MLALLLRYIGDVQLVRGGRDGLGKAQAHTDRGPQNIKAFEPARPEIKKSFTSEHI